MSATQALPGGYRIQIVRRTAGTPSEIEGEWAVHCTLCKRVTWVDTHEEAFTEAHRDHPLTESHQRYIGRVLVGATPYPLRGYHRRSGIVREQCILPCFGRYELAEHPWTPESVPQWVQERRERQLRDDLTERRQRKQISDAVEVADTWNVSVVPVGVDFINIRGRHGVTWTQAQWYEVQLAGVALTRVAALPDGRWVHRDKVYPDARRMTREVAA